MRVGRRLIALNERIPAPHVRAIDAARRARALTVPLSSVYGQVVELFAAIVTGAARGIGRAIAMRLARGGFRIVIADLNLAQAELVREEIVAGGGEAVAVRTDVSDEASCNTCAAQALESYGRIDVLVNDAAIFADLVRRPLWEIEVAEWDRVFGVNVRGMWLMMKAVFPAMRDRSSGSIINLSSNTFLSGVPGFAHYVASKGAVVGLTRSAARELGEMNIRVNCIMPGLTRTEVERAVDEPGRYDQLLHSQSIKRVSVPGDIVGTVAFLASSDSSFMTGQALAIDGGNTFH
jgi:3-oxoacyl-[acyl-carrier protein] reductase